MKLKRIALTAVVTSILAGTTLAGTVMAQTTQTSPTVPSTSPTMPAPATTAPVAKPAAPAMTAPAPATHHAHAATPFTGTVNINTASATELDKLPGIGKARAAKIIKNRPYKSPDELESKKVLPEKVYQKIKSQVVI